LLRLQAEDHGGGGRQYENGVRLSQDVERLEEAGAGGVLADQAERHPGVAV